jgi:hypothetical protein
MAGVKGMGKARTKTIPRVYNIDRGDAPAYARYCGRGTPWGNPFVIGGWWPAKQRRMTRDDVCDRFRDEILPNLDVQPLRGYDLECHCVPLRCHCMDIIRKANPGYEQKLQEAIRERKEREARALEKADRTLKAIYRDEARLSNRGVRHRNDGLDQEPDGEAG